MPFLTCIAVPILATSKDYLIFIFSSTRSNSPALINTKDGITYSDVAFSALNHAGRYAVDSSLLASQIGKIKQRPHVQGD